jgi:hypothetical protein
MKPCAAVKPVLCVTDIEGAETVISGLGVIELEDYHSLAEVRRDLGTYLHRDTIAHVHTNNEAYEELVAGVNSQLADLVEDGADKRNTLSQAIESAFVNLVFSVRLFVEHAEIDLKRRYGGDESSEFKRFKGATSREYDDSFAYRFFSKLRNYFWHSGLAGLGAKIDGDRVEQDSFEFRFQHFADVPVLLSAWNRWGRIRQELASMEPALSLPPLASAAVSCVDRLASELLDIDRPVLIEHLEIIRRLRNTVDGYEGPLYVMLVDDNFDLEHLKVLPVPRMPSSLEEYKAPDYPGFPTALMRFRMNESTQDIKGGRLTFPGSPRRRP